MRIGLGLGLLLAVAVCVAGSSRQVPTAVTPETYVASAPASGVVEAPPEAVTAQGAGFGDWWQKHGQQVVEFAGCLLDGAGIARLLIAGVSAVGGVLAAAGLVVGALACLA